MKKFLVGIDGSETPDPTYWRARNEFIKAFSAESAKKKWIKMREGWLREDEVDYIQTREIPLSANTFHANEYNFSVEGIYHMSDE